MVEHKFRWDFIGLSTDSKPTASSPKVVNGSTFYEADTSKVYIWYKDRWYEKTDTGGSYELPIASAETLGGVKIGDGLTINSETGVLSAEGGSLESIARELTEDDLENGHYYLYHLESGVYKIPKTDPNHTVYVNNGLDYWADNQIAIVEKNEGTGNYTVIFMDADFGTQWFQMNRFGGIFMGGDLTTQEAVDDLETATLGTQIADDMYDYPASDPDGVALWNLSAGAYYVEDYSTPIKLYFNSSDYIECAVANLKIKKSSLEAYILFDTIDCTAGLFGHGYKGYATTTISSGAKDDFVTYAENS